ncbi:22627_t:CDS:2 [Gigaspora margarita]|uniref:22627_t:CDS:1 n=1 Tax=Gigaspora margarita TaxID=4874 RepID=A0ABN7VWN8_GIGMA|nr:22627_t:CDS:2 [Gigaspora margarita]
MTEPLSKPESSVVDRKPIVETIIKGVTEQITYLAYKNTTREYDNYELIKYELCLICNNMKGTLSEADEGINPLSSGEKILLFN